MPSKQKGKSSRRKKSISSSKQKELQDNDESLPPSTKNTKSLLSIPRVISFIIVLPAIIFWNWLESDEESVFQNISSKLFQNSTKTVSIHQEEGKVPSTIYGSTIDPEEQKIQHFLSWLNENGATISPSVTIASFPEFGGYGLKAKNNDDIKDQEDKDESEYAIKYLDEMFTIPESIIISSKSVVKQFHSNDNLKIPQFHSRIEQILSQYIPSSYMVQQDVLIAVYLMVQCVLDVQSSFKPYLDILPPYIIPRLDTFDEEELEMLQDKELAFLAKLSYNELHRLWENDDFQSLLKSMIHVVVQDKGDLNKGRIRVEGSNHQSQCISFHSFHKFIAIVSSRAMVLQGVKYLTPLAEFANYQPRQDERKILRGKMSQSFMLYHERNNDDGSITVRADRNVSFGEQIFEDYGDIDNSLYLEAHGFVPHENPFHCAAIPTIFVPAPKDLSTTLQNALIALKMLPKENSELYPPPTICILNDGSISDNGAAIYLAIAAMGIDGRYDNLVLQCAEALNSKDEEIIEIQCANYIGHEHLLKQLVQKLSRQTMCHSTSHLKDDLTLLDSLSEEEGMAGSTSKSLTKKILALKFRIADKRILHKVVGGIENVVCFEQDSYDSDEVSMEKCPIAKVNEPVPSKRDETTNLLQKFNRFIESLDMPVQKIEATFVGKGMRIGVVAKEDIDEGEVYLSINSSSVINVNTARVGKDYPQIGAILDYHRLSSRDGGFDVLLLFLMHEKFVSRGKSKWYSYIDLLPTIDELKQTSPLFFDDILYDYAAGSNLRTSLIHNKRKAEESFAAMSLNKDILGALGPDAMQRDNFFWAYNIINSRSIWWGGKRNLVPLLDLVNCMELHNSAGSVTTVHRTFLDESNYAVTKASKAFKKGDQFFENYGQPNYIYFMYHGFSLGEKNTHDCAHWGRLGITSEDEGAQNIADTSARLSKSGFTSMNPSFCIRDISSLHRVAQFLRIKHGIMTEDENLGLSSDVLPYMKQYLRDRIRSYAVSKRSTNCNQMDVPISIRYMLEIVDQEQSYFEAALNATIGYETVHM